MYVHTQTHTPSGIAILPNDEYGASDVNRDGLRLGEGPLNLLGKLNIMGY